MIMSRTSKLALLLVLVLLPALFLRPLAWAWDGRTGDEVVIAHDQVIPDDLYVAAQTIRIDGVIQSDLMAVAETIFINGTVEGDVIAAAQTVVMTGAVNDDAFIAAAVLQIGENASVAGDLFAAGASLELRPTSRVGGDVLVGAGQVLLDGDVAGTVRAGTGALEIRGQVGGDVYAWVDVTAQSESMMPAQAYVGESAVTIPNVPAGLTIHPEARIGGRLTYTGSVDVPLPEGVVSGAIQRIEPPPEEPARQGTPAQRVKEWALQAVRQIVTLLLVGSLLAWRFPSMLQETADQVRTRFWPGLGWGVLAYAVVGFAVLLIGVVTLLIGLLAAALTLGGLSAAVAFSGLSLLLLLIVAFVLLTAYGVKIVVGEALGIWLLRRLGSPWADHRFWPMIVGVILLVVILALLRFPLIPIGLLGWLVNLGVILSGLGALWLWSRKRLTPGQPA